MENKLEIIKFKLEHKHKPLVGVDISQFCRYKLDLLKRELIGTLKEGEFAGYDCGNMSVRMVNDENELNVLITGTQTSGKLTVALNDFALILKYDPDSFLIKSCGMAKPSSETPLHWSAYEANPDINAIIHAHIFEYSPLYKHVLDFLKRKTLPLMQTPSKTREIGFEIGNLIRKRGYEDVIGMLNHDGGFGLISMGQNMKEAYSKLIRFQEQLSLYARNSIERSNGNGRNFFSSPRKP